MRNLNIFNNLVKSFFLLAFLASATFVSAQVEQTAELKVIINDVITFTLDDTNPTLIFDEADDFINGVSYSSSSAGTVTASGAFSVSVEADQSELEDNAGNEIAVSSIALQATGTGIGTATQIDLEDDDQDIISGAPAGISKTFGLTYTTTGNDDEFIGKPSGDYTVDLTFTASLD